MKYLTLSFAAILFISYQYIKRINQVLDKYYSSLDEMTDDL